MDVKSHKMNFITKKVIKNIWVPVQKILRSYGEMTHFDFSNSYLENDIMFQMVAKGYDATQGYFLFNISYHLNSFHQDLSLNDIEIHASIADKRYGVQETDKYVLPFNDLTNTTGDKIARGLVKHLKKFLKKPRQKKGNTMSDLRGQLVKLANDNPNGIRKHLVPLLKKSSNDTILGSYEKLMVDLAKSVIGEMKTKVKLQEIKVNIPNIVITVIVGGKKVKLGISPNYGTNKSKLTVNSKSLDLPHSKATPSNMANFFDGALN